MSDFRRRILQEKQKPENIEWDYEWSYLSGELPNDERFIKSVAGTMQEDGLLLANRNEKILLVDRDILTIYIKFLSSGVEKIGSLSYGLIVCLYNGTSEIPSICFSEGQDSFAIPDWNVMWLGGPTYLQNLGKFKRETVTEALIDCDMTAPITVNVKLNGEKTLQQPSRYKERGNYYEYSSVIYNKGQYGTFLIKELKFKTSDL